MSDEGLSLAEVLRDIRIELADAQTQALDQELRFSVDKVQIELNVEITKNQEVGGKASFRVLPFLGIDAEGSRGTGSTVGHKIRFDLTPLPSADEDGRPRQVKIGSADMRRDLER